MITLTLANHQYRWAQEKIIAHHYLHQPVSPRSRPLTYLVCLDGQPVGCLIFNRTEATRCFQGGLTYGSLEDVKTGRALYSRWEVLSLARVWLDPSVQAGGQHYERLPGYTDRKGVFRSTLASTCIGMALQRVVYNYLQMYPPVWIDQPYEIKVVSSYCDTRLHRGTIYRASGFSMARINESGIETWMIPTRRLTPMEDQDIRKLAAQSARSRMIRAGSKDVFQTRWEGL
jgi:hypothetical protein